MKYIYVKIYCFQERRQYNYFGNEKNYLTDYINFLNRDKYIYLQAITAIQSICSPYK